MFFAIHAENIKFKRSQRASVSLTSSVHKNSIVQILQIFIRLNQIIHAALFQPGIKRERQKCLSLSVRIRFAMMENLQRGHLNSNSRYETENS